MNFRHYPQEVTRVVALEPEPHLRGLALEAAAEQSVPIQVMPGQAEAIPFPDGSFDIAILSLVLCSVRSPDRTLEELHRVLRPGGELRFYEHVLGDRPRLARVQRGLDRFWPHLSGGCHLGRDAIGSITAAGFALDHLERFDFAPDALSAISAPHVLGVARRVAANTQASSEEGLKPEASPGAARSYRPQSAHLWAPSPELQT